MPKKVIEHLIKSKSVALFVHINPDWDCIGSAFALRGTLRSLGVLCDIFTEAPLNDYLGFMENDVIPYNENSPAPDYECYCALDVNNADRIGSWGKFFTQKENTACIDHHLGEGDFAKLCYSDHKRSSTGELVFDLLEEISFPITKEIAQYLYCAISSDTGSFQYASVNKRTYEILMALADTGIDTAYLSSMLYERNTLKKLKLQAEAIMSINVYKDGKIATAKITDEVMKKYNAVKADTEGLAQIPRTLDGVVLSAFLTEQPDGTVRASLRASGDFDVEAVARKFDGGGHKKAAGCTFHGVGADKAEELLVEELLKL